MLLFLAIMDNTINCSLNCEALNRSSVFLSSVLKTYKCIFLCLIIIIIIIYYICIAPYNAILKAL